VTADPLNRAIDGIKTDGWSTRTDRLAVLRRVATGLDTNTRPVVEAAIAAAEAVDLSPVDLPGPTGESNRLSLHPRGTVLCLGDLGSGNATTLLAQAVLALALGNAVVAIAPGAASAVSTLRAAGAPVTAIDGRVAPASLETCRPFDALVADGPSGALVEARRALAGRNGGVVPLVIGHADPHRLLVERALCVDTTAAGGNAQLLVSAAE
jgi:RHH-type proline utilization regulon transcriptional repressor/proline dehydrogenase/delta 1-pyrroline-5-carboxylate dehydrogenase